MYRYLPPSDGCVAGKQPSVPKYRSEARTMCFEGLLCWWIHCLTDADA